MTTKIYPKPNLIIQTTPKPHIKMQVLPPCKQIKKIEIKSKLSVPPKSPRQKASSTNLRQNLQKIKTDLKVPLSPMGARPTNKHNLSFYFYTFHIWKMFSTCSKLKRIDITHINIRLSKPKIQFPCWEVLSFWSLIPADDITVYVYP